jgi:LL-diaminopimelate aminotransferase
LFTANGYYSQLHGNYLFYEVGKRAAAFAAAHPEAELIRMGIGDVTRPLVPAVIEAMHKAVDEMSRAETFHGYGPDFGYDFLRQAILDRDYTARGVSLELDEIFISDGAKCDVGNILAQYRCGSYGSRLSRLCRYQCYERPRRRVRRKKRRL